MNNELEQRKQKIEKIAKYGALAVVGFLVAPFILLTIQGLIGLIVAGAISVTAINFIPWYASKLANWKLKAIKHEAAQNPIETLQNEYGKREGDLTRFGESIRTFESEVNRFTAKLVDFKKQYPEEVGKFNEQLSKMTQLLNSRKDKYKDAKKGLSLFSAEINKAQAIWEMAEAALAATNASGIDTEDFLSKIQTETALDSVQRSMSEAFANLEFSLMDEKSSAKSGNYVDSSAKTNTNKPERQVLA